MRLRFVRQSWFQILFFGLITFFALAQAARTTENPNYYPSVIALGAFLIPAAFVAWVYGHTRAVEVPLGTVGLCFLWGGLAGTILAGLIEYETLRGLGAVALLGVGLIEEGAKLAGPAILYLRGRFQRESEGILFGVASGMGFAAFETMGYGFVTLIQSRGSITDVEMTLFVRGVLSPAGHAAWTGLVCAVLWRERALRGTWWPNWRVLLAFATAVVLHALWDAANSLTGRTLIGWAGIEIVSLLVAVLSFVLLIRRIREADRERDRERGGQVGSPLPPATPARS